METEVIVHIAVMIMVSLILYTNMEILIRMSKKK